MIRKPITLERELPGVPGRTEPMPGIEFRSRSYCGSEYAELNVDVAVITISQEKARWLLGLMDVVRGLRALDREVFELRAHDGSVRWFAGDWDKVREDPETADQIPAPAPNPERLENGGDGDVRTEGDVVVVAVDHVKFLASPKHSDVEVWTDDLERATLEAIAKPPTRKPKRIPRKKAA